MTDHLTERVMCCSCKGTGNVPEEPWRVCGWCMGRGEVDVNIPVPPDLAPHQYEDDPPSRDLDVSPTEGL